MEGRCGIANARKIVESTGSNRNNDDRLLRFIKAYESLPELWNRSNPSFMNKFKKRAALEKLLEIYWEIRPQATIRDVTRKLSILRFKYMRELNKIKNSMSSDGEMDEVYRPNSWVMESLKFLDVSQSTESSLSSSNDLEDDSEIEYISDSINPQDAGSLSSPTSYQPPVKKKTSQSIAAKQDEPLDQAGDVLSKKGQLHEYDEYSLLVMWWVCKLKKMRPEIRRLAEKVITTVILNAELNKFSEESIKATLNGSKFTEESIKAILSGSKFSEESVKTIISGSSQPPVMLDSD